MEGQARTVARRQRDAIGARVLDDRLPGSLVNAAGGCCAYFECGVGWPSVHGPMATLSNLREPIVAREDERSDIVSIERSLEQGDTRRPRLVGPDDQVMILPEPLYRVLLEAARELGDGNGVALLAFAQELTTQQAADILNVSRPHVVSLLEADKIPFHKVGTHRRVHLRDLLAYKHQRDDARRRSLDAMVDQAQELGLYEE